MANCILLVFEGAVTEKLVWDNINKHYLCDHESPIICGIYGNEIYSLFHKMKKDPDLDLFLLLKENEANTDLLKDISKDQVSEIYLFFDYDGHAGGASDEKLQSMLSFFNEETENGKLYISYPMVEAVKHISKSAAFNDLRVKCKENIQYKALVRNDVDAIYSSLNKYTSDQWKFIFSEHCKKLNALMLDEYVFPSNYFDQLAVFGKQKEKHIDTENMVAVLSAFPVFLIDYYGCSKFSELIS